ncbi:MAG: hypothetical protein LQ349_008132 [Xanthoria aureola]|nr:MAG: hypothetical protein LQ349_008132 [Xanthoria aureola]
MDSGQRQHLGTAEMLFPGILISHGDEKPKTQTIRPIVMNTRDEIYEHQVPFIHPRLPDDVYTSEEMERGNSKGSLNIRAESLGSPFAAGQFPKSSNVPLKRGPPIEAESTGVSRPRKKRATGAAVDPIDLSTETSADNINGAPATPTATVTKGRKQPAVRRKPAMKKAAAGAAILPTQSLAMTRGAEMESGTPGIGSFATSILDEPKRESATEHAALSTSFTELLENEDDGAWMGMAGFAR